MPQHVPLAYCAGIICEHSCFRTKGSCVFSAFPDDLADSELTEVLARYMLYGEHIVQTGCRQYRLEQWTSTRCIDEATGTVNAPYTFWVLYVMT